MHAQVRHDMLVAFVINMYDFCYLLLIKMHFTIFILASMNYNILRQFNSWKVDIKLYKKFILLKSRIGKSAHYFNLNMHESLSTKTFNVNNKNDVSENKLTIKTGNK